MTNVFYTLVDTILLFKSRFLTGCILSLIVLILFLIAISCCSLLRNRSNKRLSEKSMINGSRHTSPSMEQIRKSEITTRSSPSIVPLVPHRSVFSPDSSTGTDEGNSNDFSLPRKFDEDDSLRLSKSDEFHRHPRVNQLVYPDDSLEFCSPNVQSGLIRPLSLRTDQPMRYSNRLRSIRASDADR